MIPFDGRQLKTVSQAMEICMKIKFFSSTDINLLLLIALSSSGSPHYMPCMTLVIAH